MYNIKTLDFKKLPRHFVMLAIGRRRSGKTTAILSVMHRLKNKYNFAIIFCGSLATCEDFAKVVPKQFVHSSFKINILDSLIARQEQKRKAGKSVPHVLLILDDLAYDSKIFKAKSITQLFFNGRHLNITLILSSQTALSIGPGLRGNTDIILCSAEKNVVYRKRIFDHYSICFRDFREFDACFMSLTENFGILTLVSFGSGYRLEDNIFYFKATFPLPNFKMNAAGSWWQMSRTKPKITSKFLVAEHMDQKQKPRSGNVVLCSLTKPPPPSIILIPTTRYWNQD